MTEKNKSVRAFAEDELSTSAGSSDNEVHSPPGLCLSHALCSAADAQRLLLQEIGPPPGLEALGAPPGLLPPHKPRAGIRTRQRKKATLSRTAPVPSAAPTVPAPSPAQREFDQTIYRKELSDILRDLSTGTNAAAGVRRVRAQNVPKERQSAEFADILTRAAEETRGVVRRLCFAFAAGLAAGGPDSAFAHEECKKGIEMFFCDIFEDLAAEVPRLRSKLANELAPTFRTVFSEEELCRLFPADCRPVVS